MTSPLPAYADDVLRGHTVAELVRLLARDDDRLPRNVIDECARRGDEMLDALTELLEKDYYWGDDQSDGEWWRLLHAVMILGLIASQRAGELLVRFMRRIDDAEDDLLDEWLSDEWPQLFLNKPASVLPALHALADDDDVGWYARSNATDAAIAWVQTNDPQALESALDRAAAVAFSKSEHVHMRSLLAGTLLRFARARHRRGLDTLANQQPEDAQWFDRTDVIRAYASGGEPPHWLGGEEPWAFYSPEAIADRQRQWAEADAELESGGGEPVDSDGVPADDVSDAPYVRPEAKVGRNDPCPCGSGKKYKKCCGS
jgi:hypothetical protein